MQALKTYLIAIVLICICGSKLQSQITYQHYLNESVEWYEEFRAAIFPGDYDCYTGGDFIGREYFHVIGIDSVDGYYWYRIHRDWQHSVQCGGSTTTNPAQGTNGVSFRIREDSTGKIWLRNPNGSIMMMYDFRPGIGVGDTLWMRNYMSFIEIASIDTVALGQETRLLYRSVCSSAAQDEYVIEGGLCSYGFLSNGYFCYPFWDAGMFMTCYSKDDSTLVLKNTMSCGVPGHIVVGVDDRIEPALTLSWNPSGESLVLQDWLPYTRSSWSVMDIAGREVKEGDHLEAEIRLPGLSSGIYLFYLHPKAGQKSLVKKFFR